LDKGLTGSERDRYLDANNRFRPLNEEFYARVSDDLRVEANLLLGADMIKRALQFYRCYPVFPKETTLTFTHYRALMRVDDPGLRRRIEQQAIREGLPFLKTKALIDELNRGASQAEVRRDTLVFTRGEPYLYCVRADSDVSGRVGEKIDCGFKIRLDFPAGTEARFQAGRIVRSIKEDGRYSLKEEKDAQDRLYTYAARVERIVDGDTLIAHVDAGFGIEIRDRFRLRGIDAPELKTTEGKAAKIFLNDYLQSCPAAVIRTFKDDKYGRYLADLFVLPDCMDPAVIARDGVYVNQLMLDHGHAALYA
jgi:endonuclease YncB( thermonuclease family)